MSERSSYPDGVPCWVETLTDDPQAAQRFYGGLFGWTFLGSGELSGDPPGEYFVARLDGADVAGIAPLPGGVEPPPPAWYTHVAVDDLSAATARARAAGAEILLEDWDASPAGRMAVLADPSGAVVCLWRGRLRPGAARVNEPSAWAMSLLSAPDPDAAAAFYGALFGWRAEPFNAGGDAPFWLFRKPGYVGGEEAQPVPRDVVAALTTAERPTGRWDVDFWIADAAAAADAAPGLGGTVLAAPTEAGGFRRTVLADPRGAPFSASQLMRGG
ncbi:MAG TPA: VOC family protein [Solirubrobacteraceae bacterium]